MYMCTCSSNRKHNRFLSYVPRMSRRTIRLGHVAPFRNATFQRTEGTHIVPYTSFFFPFVSTLAFRIVPPFSLLLLRPTIFFLFTSNAFPSQWGCPASEMFTMRAKFDVLLLSGSGPLSPFLSRYSVLVSPRSFSFCLSLSLSPSLLVIPEDLS